MSETFIPALVEDTETNTLCMQLKLGQYQATLPLPFGFGQWEQARKDNFIAMATEEMKPGLLQMRQDDRKKLRRKTV